MWIAGTAHPRDPGLFPGPPGVARTRIYLLDNGFHTDLVLPRRSVMARPGAFARAASVATSQPWIVVGWGDEGFYTRTGLTAGRTLDGLRALFWPGNPSVVRLEGLPRPPDQVYVASAVKPIWVTDAGLAPMEARVDRSLALGADGRLLPGPASGERDVAFFRSRESFSVLHVCNHWTSDLLHAAGLPTTPVLDTTPAGLKLDLAIRAGL